MIGQQVLALEQINKEDDQAEVKDYEDGDLHLCGLGLKMMEEYLQISSNQPPGHGWIILNSGCDLDKVKAPDKLINERQGPMPGARDKSSPGRKSGKL
jgi:hypothetical protein